MRPLSGLVLIAFLFIMPPVCTAEDAQIAGKGPLQVGVILPLTGRASSVGNAINNGIKLALESLSPVVRSRLVITIEDDTSDSKTAVSAYKKLLSSGQCPILISAMSNSGSALSPLTERDGVTHIALAFDTSISKGKNQTFTFWTKLADLAPAVVAEMKKRGYRSVAMVVTSHEGNIAMRRSLLSATDEAITYPVSEEVLPAEVDFSTVVTRIRSRGGLDAVANLLHPGQSGVFVKQAYTHDLRLPQFTFFSFEDSGVRKTAGPYLDDQWYTAARYSPEFVKKYRSRFPESSISGAAYGHDAILMIAEAAQQLTTASEIAKFLRGVKDFHGAIAGFSADGENGFKVPIEIKTVGKDGL